MAIHVRLEDENGQPLAVLNSPPWLTNWMLSCTDLSQTTCLGFIDRYGDTLFNRAQMQALIRELADVDAALSDEAVERAYQGWLARFAGMDPAIDAYARTYPKPTQSAIRAHLIALQELAKEGLRIPHRYLRFIGD
jgi:hypothetical protein